MKHKQKQMLKMISSGVRRHFPEPEGTRLADRAAELYHTYCREHQDDSEALKQHTEGMIYAGAAMYRALQEYGMSPEEALALTDRIIQDYVQTPANMIRGFLKLPGLYRKIPGIFRSMVQKKYPPEAGFQMTFYPEGKGRAKFDVTACPYHRVCTALGYPELTTVFCNTDDTCYGNMHPKLRWNRTQTIGRGGSHCDFDIEVLDK